MDKEEWISIGDAASAVIDSCAEMLDMLTKTNAVLKSHANRISRLEEQKAEIAEEIKEAYEYAKSEGFTVSALRKAIKIHSLDQAKREKHDAEQMDLELYLEQLEGKAAE